MVTCHIRLVVLSVQVRPPDPEEEEIMFKRLTVFFLVFSLFVFSSSSFYDYYNYDVSVDYDTMADILFSADSGIMPLDFTSSDSTTLSNIASRLLYGGQSVAYYLAQIDSSNRLINQKLGFNNATLETNLGVLANYLQSIKNSIYGNGNTPSVNNNLNSNMVNGINAILRQMQTAGGSESTYTGEFYNAIGKYNSVSDLSQASIAALASNYLMYNLAAGPGEHFLNDDGSIVVTSQGSPLSGWLRYSLMGLASLQRGDDNPYILTSAGSVGQVGEHVSLWYMTGHGFLGLSHNLVGDDNRTAFSFLSEDIKSSQTVETDNVLDAIGIMSTNLQNPLQRLAYVFANPQDLEIREDVSEETEAVDDNFFKPGSPGKVDKGDIGDAASFVSGSGQLLTSPGSAADAFSEVNGDYDFWSQGTADNLDQVDASSSARVASEVWYSDAVLDDDGFYHFYDPDALSKFFEGR